MAGKVDLIPVPEKFVNFKNWVPARVYWNGAEFFVDWCYLGEDRFTSPFFEDTVAQRMSDPFSLLFRHQTPLEFLPELSAARPGLKPDGFIFHMSRCGSTLVTQMLAALPQNIVVSEPLTVDSVLRINFAGQGVDPEQRIRWLRSMIDVIGHRRTGEEKHYFIKFDSWNMFDLELILRAFPDVPWIFLYRDPIEVIVSQMNARGSQMIPGTIGRTLPEFNLEEIWKMPGEEYCARMLARFCEIALQHAGHKNGLLVNYTELPEAVTSSILKHFGVTYLSEEIGKMKSAAKYNAKSPQTTFTPDSEKKRSGASEAAQLAAATLVDPLYEKLEELRRLKQ